MKVLSTIFFIILIGLLYLTQPTLSQDCLEYVNIIRGAETKRVACPRVSSPIDKRQTPDNMFIVNFNCASSVKDQSLCDKVKNVFFTAGKFITSTLNLKAAITVNAQLEDFCATQQLCNSQETVLGAGKPSRLIPHTDTDGKMRFYPQSLFKQLNLPEHPQYGADDITAIFNSNINYFFEGDQSLSPRQVDMLYVVIHELVHGLGFVPAWNDHMNIQALTPGLGISNGKAQFLETVFDKSLVLFPEGKPLTSITDELNQFQFSPDMSDDQIVTSFKASPQYPIAQDMYNKAMTHGTMAFLTNPGVQPNTPLTLNDVVLLETSIKPYQPGSSIGHVDFQTYLPTGDFLMMYTYPHATLGQMMNKASSTNTTGPMGSRLRALLGILGYDVKQDYTPPATLSNFGDPSDVAKGGGSGFDPSNPFNIPHNGSSPINFNLGLSLACILLTFIYNISFKVV